MKSMQMLVLAAACAACNNSTPGTSAAVGTDGANETPIASPVGAGTAEAAAKYREVTLPEGTMLRLRLASAVGSDMSEVEDTVRAELRQAIAVKGQTVLPAGTEVVGAVTDVERSGRVKGRAHVSYRFSSLRYHGERYDIRTAPVAHQAEATKGEDAKKIAIGAGAGAAVGALLGGGSGAAKGAAIGGAGGTGVVLATRGKEVKLGPGAAVTTRLTAPLTLRVRL